MSVPIASIGEDAFGGLDLPSAASPAPRSPFGSPFDDDGVGVSARSGVDPDSASLLASVREENATAGAFAITGDSDIARASFARACASRVGVTRDVETIQNSNARGFATRAVDASRVG